MTTRIPTQRTPRHTHGPVCDCPIYDARTDVPEWRQAAPMTRATAYTEIVRMRNMFPRQATR